MHFTGKGQGAVFQGRCSTLDTFKPGDVLVARMTSPDHVDKIVMAGAVVTEIGGVLSHAAVVCIERGIPFVVGAKGAMALAGQFVRVDPEKGLVEAL